MEAIEIQPPATGRLAVYVRCAGTGYLEVEVQGIVALTQRCASAADVGTRNTIGFDDVDGPVTVTGSARDDDIWALAVTQILDR